MILDVGISVKARNMPSGQTATAFIERREVVKFSYSPSGNAYTLLQYIKLSDKL